MENKKRNKSFWLEWMSFLDKLIQKMRINKIKNFIDFNNKDIVDTWCWFNAVFLQNILKNSNIKSLTAVDLKLNSELNNIWIKTVESDLNKKIDLIDNSIDIIVSMAILEHLENPVWYLENIFRILKKDWTLLMTVPSTYSKPVLEFLAFKLGVISKEEILDHKEYYDRKKLLNLLKKVGFEDEKINHKYFQFWMNNLVIAKK